MSQSGQDTSSLGQILADGHAARVLANGVRLHRQLSENRTQTAVTTPSIKALLDHAERKPSSVADFAMERELRRSAVAMNRYRNILRGVSIAHSSVALAASGAQATMQRRIGPYELSVTYDGVNSSSTMMIHRQANAAWPSTIEVHQADQTVRLSLPPPLGVQILILLDPGIASTALLARLLAEPDCEIYFI